VPVKSVAELVAYAKANPGKLHFGSGGVGSTPHLAGEMLKSMAGIDATHVPYKGGGPALADLASGQIQFMLENIPSTAPYVASGRLRALAVTDLKRSQVLPDVPTLDESGVKGFDVVTWFGYAAPAGTPAAVIQRLRDEFAKAASDPAIKAKLTEAGLDPMDQLQPADFAKLIDSDLEKWTPIIKASGARVD
jgi:tripartite-type tricarboxylate transporter receptor subunit TctC